MKFLIFALAATALPVINAASNFKSTCSTVNNQMATLTGSLAQLKATADKLGHYHISSRCDEASQHLGYAKSSWGGISSGYGSFPWQARDSSHASRVQSRMSSCGSSLDWIYSQPEVSRYSDYRTPVQNCRRTYNSCQTGCTQIWNWPSPPGYKPRPSQQAGYRRHRRDTDEKVCPNTQETACPISANATGFECVDTQTEITSCGGCESLNEGENCLTIEGADEVGCELGECRVFSALPGFEINKENGRPTPVDVPDWE
ncbi:hypothetical protein PGT21_009097 [Puccinia graminis f. sp. tritici]|uniref:Protein CPL1-like domain-containing protein n=2 Tax=Puccinia graminis f. sp. tritici TaxID=56615 RepID=E3JU42_PUCGT|nr:uncharacterized protein PGTG_00898 [Puccinia graminis f. sp. tritici CRL 75-36-700-3]KAA1073965.1 hypothetical protein PGTUg99_027300 [Puccinia graminis f. sp. tritici]EFP75567.1 hypothetical protein PGTG_00898 [Puccinia graminis f. sp. tritici CRL 75-36-700-3]KAA1107317.1 hypothetical protein PGT21_009946 [Puccinia graminis f. sp. tritici]KAA1116315.1 hypothetical protein PGT21_009097 [Puccinia graminis f. sp. tritici]KAA1124897.1 hypothetical protein PGTUg99_036495 [Puccinia graminis f. s